MPEPDKPQGEQAPTPKADPPFKDELTIIWKQEKAQIHGRLDMQEKVIEHLAQRVKTLEAHALSKVDRTAWDARDVPSPGAGIGHPIPNPLRGPKIPESDYEGPKEGHGPS